MNDMMAVDPFTPGEILEAKEVAAWLNCHVSTVGVVAASRLVDARRAAHVAGRHDKSASARWRSPCRVGAWSNGSH
jgi:hypothetical protein